MHLRYSYYDKRERDILRKKLSWDELRYLIKKGKLKAGNKCRKCVWADTESGYILCPRDICIKKDDK